MNDPIFSNPPEEVTSPRPARQVYAPEFTHFADDDIHADTDDYRDRHLIDQLVENEDLPSDWRPDPKDIC